MDALTVLIAAETLLLVLLALLVAGLLRSHAEILRRLGPAPEGGDPEATVPGPRSVEAARAFDVAGTTLGGDPVQIGLADGGRSTLLAFLSSGCSICAELWAAPEDGARALPAGSRLVIVTKDAGEESAVRLRELAGGEATVVMSSRAWGDYQVPGAPYFVYVDGPSGEIRGEGSARAWAQVGSLLRDALEDMTGSPSGGGRPNADGASRALRIERELEAAGIGPDHPSLYPDRGAAERRGT